MKHQSPTIVLAGGGSGGHITPLLSLARELKAESPSCQIIYIGHKGDDVDTFKSTSHDFDFMAFIKAGKLRRYHGSFAMGVFRPRTMALNLRDLLRLPKSLLLCWRLLGKFKPNVVFSKGGFVAVPVCAAAKLRGIPIITHDSDAAPGLANRLSGRWAKIHATGMPPEYYSYPKRSVAYVGIPLDSRIKKVTPKLQREAKQKLNLSAESRLVLVSGGGNGSKRINDLMLSLTAELLGDDLSIHIIHMAGVAHEVSVKQAYRKLPKAISQRVSVYGYSNDFHTFAEAADVVITRAGATTLAELAAAGKTCIVIPAPFLAGGHQMKNAGRLAEKDAVVVADNEAQPDELLVLIKGLLNDDHRRFELSRNLFATAKTDAAAKLAELILTLAGREG